MLDTFGGGWNGTDAPLAIVAHRFSDDAATIAGAICARLIVSFDSSYARENLTLDGLEQSTTTSRDVRYLVGQTELVDTSYRVTTTNQ